jgi:Proton-conducting membrane transporter
MSILIVAGIALVAGLASLVSATPFRRASLAIGIVGAVVVLIVALAMPAEDSVGIGETGLVLSDVVRVVALGWAGGLVLLALLELLAGGPPVVSGPSLVGLSVAVLALASRDPVTSFATLAAGGVAGITVPSAAGWSASLPRPTRLAAASRGTLAVLGSGLLGMLVVAWGASPAGPLSGSQPGTVDAARLALGAALLAMVGAVGLRSGLIPLHVWVARFVESVSPLAIPATFAWGTAVFFLVAIDWSQVAIGPALVGTPERVVIVVLAVTSIVFGGLAALVHDDIEHVLGYSILQDAGVAALVFASLDTTAAAAARDWLVAGAAVKTAFAGWVTVTRTTFGAHRLADLSGWARRAPILGVAFGAIWLAAVGLPGMALFDARSTLVTGVIGGPLGGLVFVTALSPILSLGRIAAAGAGRPSSYVAMGPSEALRWGGRTSGWSRGSALLAVRAIPFLVRANRTPLGALGALGLAGIGLALAILGTGS